MTAQTIFCIVEGDGECKAVPTLVNRILKRLRRERVVKADPSRTICTHDGARITEPYDRERKLGVEFFVERAAREKPAGILVVVDAEERCLARRDAGLPGLGIELKSRAQRIAGNIPLGVVVANRMFEAWVLSDFHSLRARGHLPAGARLEEWEEPESLSGCKGYIRDLLGRKYRETQDQPRLAEHISLPLKPAMRRRAPSFFKLFREVKEISKRVMETRCGDGRGRVDSL